MLFNSYSFLFLFLPATCLGYLLVGRLNSRQASLAWLVLCSIAFYGVWNPMNLVVMLPSIGINYLAAVTIKRLLKRGDPGRRTASSLLLIGVAFNLLFLGYFKYKNFFLETTNELLGTDLPLAAVILPLGISFITFKQIAFLSDVRKGKIDFNVLDYLTFVFFFPQLIAGPIVHYGEVIPQFEQIKYRLDTRDIVVGICLLSIGLFKKTVLADGMAANVSPIFSATDQEETISFLAAWMGALAYTFQIYFDFSGYSDMALGLARLFGIRLPLNFDSPFKSSSIIEFWSRWHVTLTRFLTTYIYMPVMRHVSRWRRRFGLPILTNKSLTVGAFISLAMAPAVLTMFLSGVWHGAGFTFVLWGLLHGLYICINQAWRFWRPKWNRVSYESVMGPVGFLLTFGAVVIAIVFFRARSVAAAGRVLHAMFGLDGISLPITIMNRLGFIGHFLGSLGVTGNLSSGASFVISSLSLIALFVIATLGPNSLEILRDFDPAFHYPPTSTKSAIAPSDIIMKRGWRRALSFKLQLSPVWAFAVAVLFVLGSFGLNQVSQFLYWKF